MRRFVFLMFFILGSCGDSNPVITADSTGTPFWLEVGQSAKLDADNLQIKFEKVISDSRCPFEARCFVAGKAEILLYLHSPGEISAFVKPTIPDYVLATDTSYHVVTDTLGYRIKLMQLDPYPTLDGAREYSQYNALLSVSRLSKR